MAASFLSRAIKKLQTHTGPAAKRKTSDPKWNADFDRLMAGNRTKAELRNSSVVTPISMYLGHVSFERAVDGQFAVLSGDQAGWADLVLSWRCLAWNVRIWSHEMDRLNTTRWDGDDYAAALLGAVTFGNDSFATWCMDWIRQRILRERADSTERPMWNRPVYWYVLRLAYLKLGREWD